jgi:hypothetical protein
MTKFQVRCQDSELAEWRAAAEVWGVSVSAFVKAAVNARCQEKPGRVLPAVVAVVADALPRDVPARTLRSGACPMFAPSGTACRSCGKVHR